MMTPRILAEKLEGWSCYLEIGKTVGSVRFWVEIRIRFGQIGCEVPSKLGFSSGSAVKNPPARQETHEMQVQSLDGEDPLEKEMATNSSILAWEIPWTEDPGGLQLIGS